MLSVAYHDVQISSEEVFMEIKSKFWIENKGEVVVGSGKGAIKKMEQRAGFKIVETKMGGRDRGAQLTPKGETFVKATDALFRDLQTIVEKRFQRKFRNHSSK
jgi:molybdate transport repressor ModE-like protein